MVSTMGSGSTRRQSISSPLTRRECTKRHYCALLGGPGTRPVYPFFYRTLPTFSLYPFHQRSHERELKRVGARKKGATPDPSRVQGRVPRLCTYPVHMPLPTMKVPMRNPCSPMIEKLRARRKDRHAAPRCLTQIGRWVVVVFHSASSFIFFWNACHVK